MSSDTPFREINEAKANMDHIYDQHDPRAYFCELEKLDYAIPDKAKPIFRKLISHLQQDRDGTVQILDLGCSYGVNAAILKYDLSMQNLYEHWNHKRMTNATPKEIADYNRQYFANLDAPEDIEVIGLDQAMNAIAYAVDVGLLDEGLSVNLENDGLSTHENEELAAVDLVMSTGCVGYLTERSFDRLLPAVTQGRAPWIANFVLRSFSFDIIEEHLSDWGYVTEKLENRTFFQRRFASKNEKKQLLEKLCEQGVDPTGLEGKGNLCAELYLSRPYHDVADMPIERLLAA